MNDLRPFISGSSLGLIMLALIGCQSIPTKTKVVTTSPLFTEQHQDIQFESKYRRKWDNAVIADLDQDGYADLLLTDHGYTVKLFWNNQGVYEQGIDLIVGDMHGIGVDDFDHDGRLDVLISRGGGSGTNARNAKLFHFENRTIIEGQDFIPPLPKIRGRTSKFFDSNNDGYSDLLLMGFPSMGIGKQTENFIFKNDGKANFVHQTDLKQTYRDGQKVLITDFNNDYINDLLIYGNAHVIALQGKGDFQYIDVTQKLLGGKITDVTGIAEIDFDNDGDFDLYFTRAIDFNAGDTFYDAGSQTLAFYTKRGPFKLDDFQMGETFELSNYQSPYPDQAVYIAEGAYQYKFKGERHSGQHIELESSIALGWPDKPNKSGLYIGYIGNDKWRVAGNTFPPTSGVINGVKHYDATVRPAAPRDLLLENRGGKFVDVTEVSGLGNIFEHTTGVAVADIDNSGLNDIVVLKQGNMMTPSEQLVLLNNGEGQFVKMKNHGVITQELGAIGAGVDAFDYNLDGQVDLIAANERGMWHLFKNQQLTSNNYTLLHLTSNITHTLQGAKITLKACNQQQVSRIGATAAPYSQSLNTTLHFGLGACQLIDEVSITLSSGITKTFTSIAVDAVNKLVLIE